jgi:hypothetical protein
MTPVFADSYYYVALLVNTDQAHQQTVEITQRLQAPILTTVWVLTEVANALASPRFRAAFLNLLDDLRAAPEVTIVPADQDLFERGLELYRHRPDKAWSLTDCISFVVMERERITEALTGDHHFEQAGFTLLYR